MLSQYIHKTCSRYICKHVYHSQIRLYEMDIKCSYIYNIEHRNLETRKTLTTSQFRYETFYYL